MRNQTSDLIGKFLNTQHDITTLDHLYEFFCRITYHEDVFDITYPCSDMNYKPVVYCCFHTIFQDAVITIYGYFEDNKITFSAKY